MDHVAEASTDAAWALKKNAQGDYSPDLKEHRFGAPFNAAPSQGPSPSLDQLFESWIAEAKPAASTVSTWRTVVRSLSAHTGSKKASSITTGDMVAWKDTLVARSLASKTINDSYLSCANALFEFARRNGKISTNPALGVRAVARSRAGQSRLPYSDVEVARLLALSSRETKPALRWLPLMAATTGARIGELVQIWSDQIEAVDGIYVLQIRAAPDGGSLKNPGSERQVPLHDSLVEAGFLKFASRATPTPLFYKQSKAAAGSRHASKGVANRLASWIRDKGFRDPRKAPTHALRHWWKTAAAKAGLQDSLADAIQGHKTAGEASTYRHFDASALKKAIDTINIPESLTQSELAKKE